MARPSARVGLVAGLLLGVACWSFGGPTSASGAEPLRTGFTDPLTTYEGAPLAFQRMRYAGAQYVRLTIGWDSVAPRTEPSNWDPANPADPNYWWPNADRQVTNAVAAGLTPVIAVTGAPNWAQGCAERPYPGAVCNPDIAAYLSFARAIARRYSGSFGGLPRVRYWSPFNEPNLFLFFNPQFAPDGHPLSPDVYREILDGFSAAVKSAAPSNLVISAGLAPLERPGGLGPLAFARQLLCMQGRRRPRPLPGGCGGGVPIDIFAMNPYTTGGPTHRPSGPNDISIGNLGELQKLILAADRAGHIAGAYKRTPLWVTEFSWDSRPPDPGGLPFRIEDHWVAEALYRAYRAGVRVFFWYGLRDAARNGLPPSQTVESGLYFRGGSLEADKPKPILSAFRFPFVALRRKGGFLVWGRAPTVAGGRVAIQVERRHRWTRVALLKLPRGGTFQARVQARYNGRGSVRAVFRRQRSLPFSLRPIPDFYQPPFG